MKINLHDIADADIIKTLFAENPGVVIQVSDAHKDELILQDLSDTHNLMHLE